VTDGGRDEEPAQDESSKSSVEEEKCQKEPSKVERGEKVLYLTEGGIFPTTDRRRERFFRDMNENLF
jgi:hypothetical protein